MLFMAFTGYEDDMSVLAFELGFSSYTGLCLVARERCKINIFDSSLPRSLYVCD
jgi:hypothetical protein